MASRIGSRSPAMPPPSTGASAQIRQGIRRLLGLGREHQDIVGPQVDLIGRSDRRDGQRDVLLGRSQPQAPLAQGLEMITAGHQDDLAPACCNRAPIPPPTAPAPK